MVAGVRLTRFGKFPQVGTLTRLGNPFEVPITSLGKSPQVNRGVFQLAWSCYRYPRRAGYVGQRPESRSGPITRLLWVGPMPRAASASAVVIPAISSRPSRSDCGGRPAMASATISGSMLRLPPPGMHGPMSLARCGRTASLSWVQNVRQRTCYPGASHSSDRSDLQPGTGQSARHWPLASRWEPSPSRASHQQAMAQSSAVGSPRPHATRGQPRLGRA